MRTERRNIAVIVACLASTACNFHDDDDPPNAPPQFGAQQFAGIEDTAIDAQLIATDPGDTLSFSVVGPPQHGVLTLSSSGSFRYIPSTNFHGADEFVAGVRDGAQHLVEAPIRLEISPVNDAPVLVDDVFAVTATSSLPVLANDTDPEGDAFVLEWVDTPLVGSASVTAGGTVDLQLPADFEGLTTFRYGVREMTGLTSEATALVYVGIEPFKIVYLGSEGVYVDDLLTTSRASAPEGSPTRIVSMTAAANGRALAYLTRETAGDTYRLMYVDLDEPGVARPVSPSMTLQSAYRISADGRYVAFEVIDFPEGARTSLLLFDARSTAPPAILGQVVDMRRRVAVGAYPEFNAAGTRLYYIAEVPADPEFHALHRIELATGLTTRVSPANGGYDAFGGYWVAHNESRIVLRYRQRVVGAFPYSDAYLGDPNQPDVLTPLTPDVIDHEIAVPPTISPDGSYVFLTVLGASPNPFGVRSPRVVPTVAPTAYREVGSPETWTGAETQGLDPTHMRADSLAMLFVTQWNTAGTNVYEVPLDDPDTLTLVNAPTLANESVTRSRYDPDGNRLFYLRHNLQSGARALEMTRREAFQTSTPLTLPGEQVLGYRLDPSGRVALIVRDHVPESPYALVNADSPQAYLPLAGAGMTTTGAVMLVAR